MLNIAVCDDLQKDRIKLGDDIRAFFNDRDEKADLFMYESGEELLSEIKNIKFDVIFLDIYMEGISGVDVSKQIREMGFETAIIYTTTSPDHAMAGYGVRVSDYLLKPFERKDVFVALDYAISHMPDRKESIEVISDRNHITLNIYQIMYVEVYGHESKIHMENGDVISVNKALKDIEDELGNDFIRCHKSYLVNLSYITRPIKGNFVLTNDEKVPIGTDIEKQSREKFFDWSFNRTWGNW